MLYVYVIRNILYIFLSECLITVIEQYNVYGVIQFQDSMDTLFKSESSGSFGSLAQIRIFFGHKSMKPDVMQNYQHVVDILQVMIEWRYKIMFFLNSLYLHTFPQSTMMWYGRTEILVCIIIRYCGNANGDYTNEKLYWSCKNAYQQQIWYNERIIVFYINYFAIFLYFYYFLWGWVHFRPFVVDLL